jgi:hypothetical protein
VEILNGKRRDAEKERCQVGKEEGNVAHVLLKNIESNRRGEKILDNNWLHINGEPSYKKIIG